MKYSDFIASKAVRVPAAGFEPGLVSPLLFPFQRALVDWAVRRGRAAVFADCGLGKTNVLLAWATQVAERTGRPVLVLSPLAVAQQTIREAAKFGFHAAYAKEQAEASGPIVVTNYERLHLFDAAAFGGAVLDESGILKSFMGKTKRTILESFGETPYRLACTATPAPNDHLELGNHAEFLGVLTSHEMIARWFINDTSTFGTYRLKHYAVQSFWDWVSSWARCLGTPADIGFDDAGYVLPELVVDRHPLSVDLVTDRGDRLFRIPDLSATSVHKERRRTAGERARRIAELARAEPGESWLLWCESDYEADALGEALPEATDVRGSDSLETKEARLAAFAAGEIRILITKPSLAGFGLNFQHCARVAFIGPTFSYESYYQAIRRTWRFGQSRPVHVHVVIASTEAGVLDVLLRKERDHERMKVEMFAAARRALQADERAAVAYDPKHVTRLPSWLVSKAQ